MNDAIGRRASGFIVGMGGAIFMVLAGYYYDAAVAGYRCSGF